MRTYPLPRLVVDTVLASLAPDPVLASGKATEEQILRIFDQVQDGPTEGTGGEAGQRWLERMAEKFQQDADPCFDCEDAGLYAITDPDDESIAYDVVRSWDWENFEKWSGKKWDDWTPPDQIDLRILTEDSARFVMDALDEGCDGAYLHPGSPVGFLSRDEEVIIAASEWKEEDHPREKGKFAKKDQNQAAQQKGAARGKDMARYIKEGGKRPVGVKALEKKGKGGKGKGKKGKSAGQLKKDQIGKQQAAEREAKAAADLKAEQDKQARKAKAEADRKAIADEFVKQVKSGVDIKEAEAQARNTASEQARKAAAVEKEAADREKLRKLEYSARMAGLSALKKSITSSAATPDTPDDETGWVAYAVVDNLDPNAVMAMIRLRQSDKGLELQTWQNGDWAEDPKMLAELRGVDPPPLVELSEDQIEMLLKQMMPAAPEEETATTAAFSPDPRAAKLRTYWVSGKGRLKIKWGAPGDFKRCVKHLRKYVPAQVEGYCANLHKLATGMWPGDRRNRGVNGTGASEDVLWDALLCGGWILEQPSEVDMLNDGIYSETEDDLMGAIVAGASFPVSPPDEWFQNPGLPGPTPLTVDENGHVYGHIATFDVPHIGMPGKVHAPRSKSGYAFFKTGQLVTASGGKINVGQLTLAGGHAPLSADAATAVAHYDNTDSAVADLNIGEDRYGIWVAGAVRPEISHDQMRSLRAAAPSGDWRPINGGLELVAICQVNVPGFPVARARVASGAVVALVAAGARPLAVQRASMLADAAVLERMGNLEKLVLGPVDTDEAEIEAADDEVQDTADVEKPEVPESVRKVREYLREQRMEKLRQRVRGARQPKADADVDSDTEGD